MTLANAYNPEAYENDLSAEWRKQKVGSPEKQAKAQNLTEDAETYAIIMPPPNLTAKLHAGHALNHYLQDTLARIQRQRGKKTLLFPGVDHGGIQLEGVVNSLLAKEGANWEDLSYDEYLALCWKKAKEWRNDQAEQAKIMGTSADYDRELFTLDPRATRMVEFAFKHYWQDNLLYKSSYIVNWSVGLQTALSDVSGEIIYETRVDPLVEFRYGNVRVEVAFDKVKLLSLAKLVQKALTKRPITVSTVRPETIFGDVAIAIHPTKLQDKFHKILTEAEILEVMQAIETSEILIFQDMPEFEVTARVLISDKVDAGFGSGALKITPGSDIFDWQLYSEDFVAFQLPPFIQTIERTGKLSEHVPEAFRGMSREKARVRTIELLIESGYIAKSQSPLKVTKEYSSIKDVENYLIDWNYEHNVSLCERSKTIIEPLVSEEFYLSYSQATSRDGKSLKELARVGIAQTNFYPLEFRSMADNFIDNLNDWCISRDRIWGHAMPIWYNLDLNPLKKFYPKTATKIEFEGTEYPLEKLMRIQSEKPYDLGTWEQETKILDTWFSSALWPLTTLDYYASNPKIEAIVTDISGVFWDEKNNEREGVVTFLQQAKEAGIKIYYLSNLSNQSMYDSLKASPNFGLFDGGTSAYQSGQNKSSEQIFRLLLANYDLDASKVFYIDDISEYVAVAKKVGMNAFWYTPLTDLSELFTQILTTKHTDFEEYYPTNYMNTAKEIFYLWIVRMIVLGVYFTGVTPFKNVMITPTVVDEKGRKMSKSLGNGLDPEEAISRFSSDSLRLGMLSGVIPNRNMKFGGSIADTTMEKMRNFGNKLWNIARFLEYKEIKPNHEIVIAPATNWIMGRYLEVFEKVELIEKNYDFVVVVNAIIDFVWYDFADIYVEYLKTDESQLPLALELYTQMILLLHPFLPFETEVIARDFLDMKSLVHTQINLDWTEKYQIRNNEFQEAIELMNEIRSQKGIYGIKPTEKIEIATDSELVIKYSAFLGMLTKANFVEHAGQDWLIIQKNTAQLALNIASSLHNIPAELEKNERDIQKNSNLQISLTARLESPQFLEKAESEAIEQSKSDLDKLKVERENLQSKAIYLHKLQQ